MEKLPICRICLTENVGMHVVVNKNLHDLYEKLTDIPFVTEDSRPILACFFCCTKLKQCYRLMRQCLEAEELFPQMMNEDYEPKSLINQNHFEFCSGFVISPIVHVSIDDGCQTDSIALKEELPAVCEELDDIIEPKKEHLSYELEQGSSDNSCLDVADLPPHRSESDLENDISFMELETKVEKEQVAKKKQSAREKTRATVAKKPKLDTRRPNQEDAITAEETKKEKSDLNVRTNQKRTSNPDQRSFSQKGDLSTHIRGHTGEKPYKCDVCQRTFIGKSYLKQHIRIHTDEKPFKCNICQKSYVNNSVLSQHILIHTGEKPYKCNVCERSFNRQSSLTRHNRVMKKIQHTRTQSIKESSRIE